MSLFPESEAHDAPNAAIIVLHAAPAFRAENFDRRAADARAARLLAEL
jgi:hypothetical protein